VLTFWIAPNDDSSTVDVLWEGKAALPLNPAPFVHGYTEYTVPLTATQSGSELRFGVQIFENGLNLDDVSVVPVSTTTAVPEPASCMLVGSGLVGLFAGVRRRRNATDR
jgi:hypothetical protein